MTLKLFATSSPSRSAVISDCGRYRYRLDRLFGEGGRVCWVMLNPSTADATETDPTLTKCIGFSQRWGFGSLVVVNLYAWRSTDPKLLPREPDIAVGPKADKHIDAALRESALVVCGWGNSVPTKRRAPRERHVMGLIRAAGHTPRALRFTNDGAPWHPLYLPGDSVPVDFAEVA